MTDVGASHAEQLLESARRNNTELLLQIKLDLGNDSEKLSALINSTRELITNNTALHIACQFGHWEFIDIILDIEGVEVDPTNRHGLTPLHLAVKYANDEPEHGYFIVDNLIDAGCDPRILDSDKLKPINYVRDNANLRELLESAEYAISMEVPDDNDVQDDDDEASASDSD